MDDFLDELYPELTLETEDIIMSLSIKKDYSQIKDFDKRKEEFIKDLHDFINEFSECPIGEIKYIAASHTESGFYHFSFNGSEIGHSFELLLSTTFLGRWQWNIFRRIHLRGFFMCIIIHTYFFVGGGGGADCFTFGNSLVFVVSAIITSF